MFYIQHNHKLYTFSTIEPTGFVFSCLGSKQTSVLLLVLYRCNLICTLFSTIKFHFCDSSILCGWRYWRMFWVIRVCVWTFVASEAMVNWHQVVQHTPPLSFVPAVGPVSTTKMSKLSMKMYARRPKKSLTRKRGKPNFKRSSSKSRF